MLNQKSLFLLIAFLVCPTKSWGESSNSEDTLCAQQQSDWHEWLEWLTPYFEYQMRFQWDKMTGSAERQRGRHRMRAGLKVKPNDLIRFVVGISTGGGNPRSTNHTFAREWDKPGFRLERLNVLISATEWSEVIGGKFSISQAVWSPSDQLWDSDIYPLGVAAVLSPSFGNGGRGFIRGGYLAVKELHHKQDAPQTLFTQGGFKWDQEQFFSEAALAFYGVTNPRNSAYNFSAETNTKRADNTNKYKFNTITPAVEIGLKDVVPTFIPAASVFAESVHNFDPSKANYGFIVGLKVGEREAPKKQGKWRADYSFRVLERDAWMDTFPDSNVFSGGTNARAHKLRFQISPVDHVVVGCAYYNITSLSGSKMREQLVQVDGSLVF